MRAQSIGRARMPQSRDPFAARADMTNPWLHIPLADYEAHMALPEVAQAEMLAEELEIAIRRRVPDSCAIIGCVGGNESAGTR